MERIRMEQSAGLDEWCADGWKMAHSARPPFVASRPISSQPSPARPILAAADCGQIGQQVPPQDVRAQRLPRLLHGGRCRRNLPARLRASTPTDGRTDGRMDRWRRPPPVHRLRHSAGLLAYPKGRKEEREKGGRRRRRRRRRRD